LIPPGIDLGSSGSSGAPGTTGSYYYIETTNFDLSNYPAGTTATAEYEGPSNCVFNVTGRGFNISQGGGPTDACFWEQSYAQYKVTLLTPDYWQRPVAHIMYDFTNINYLTPIGTASCIDLSTITCSGGGSIGVVGVDTVLEPKPTLSAPPAAPLASWRYCSGEGAPCDAPAHAIISFGNGPNRVQTQHTIGQIACDATSFGNVDPAPGKYKDCFIVK
jgi:hypothetical protein